MKTVNCKFCGKEAPKRYDGYCQVCWRYFKIDKNDYWSPSKYGSISKVEKENHKQYGQLICHECGKAFIKLQQHIWYAHHMAKNEYCDKWGLDHKIRLTENDYNKKMSDYAYKYNMDKQLKRVGKNTRFINGHKNNYKRSYQTIQRLSKNMIKRRSN